MLFFKQKPYTYYLCCLGKLCLISGLIFSLRSKSPYQFNVRCWRQEKSFLDEKNDCLFNPTLKNFLHPYCLDKYLWVSVCVCVLVCTCVSVCVHLSECWWVGRLICICLKVGLSLIDTGVQQWKTKQCITLNLGIQIKIRCYHLSWFPTSEIPTFSSLFFHRRNQVEVGYCGWGSYLVGTYSKHVGLF